MLRINQYSTLLCAFIFSLTLSACAGVKVWPGKAGQVLDETTNQPIAGAIVVALWEGHRSHAFIKSRRVCYHVETTTTDQQGRYSFASRFDGLMRGQIYDKFTYHSIYKAGYVTSDKTYEKAAYSKNLKYLKPFKGTKRERIALAEKFITTTSCHRAGRSNRKLFPVYDQVYKDVYKYGLSENKNRWFLLMVARAATSEEGFITSQEGELRMEEFLKGYLQP